MATSRRSFLKQGTLLAVAAGIPAGLARRTAANEISGQSDNGSALTMAAFAAQINTTFEISKAKSKVPVKLVEVANLNSKKPRDGEAFLLSFRGDHITRLKQDTYVIDHKKLGTFSFLVVPMLSRDKNARFYEVVVNRLHS